jgi:EF hand
MVKMYRSIARVLAVSAAFFSVPALAQSATTGPGQAPSATTALADKSSLDFDQVDANKDGNIDKKEAISVPGLLAVFEKADADRDGRLNRAEFRMAEAQMKRS